MPFLLACASHMHSFIGFTFYAQIWVCEPVLRIGLASKVCAIGPTWMCFLVLSHFFRCTKAS
ncbi:hypothetical protein BDV96DRAFT_573190 [Lophiotrema nucula]|uniref:Uncharacterized protein n=1 Tax=Lophiotrema nucula TaxID=690887 RepID=A0A6A5Z9R2_9PLEO|nr:hypothetical protein BDV96DRAFT_573190 [Lophiotrema nucula]